MQVPWLVKYQYAATLFVTIALSKVTCFYFNFPTFEPENQSNLWLHDNSKIFLDAIQVTPDIRGSMENYSGRVIYRKPYRLWKQKKNHNQMASFNTTFVLRITPETTPGGEGLAFILTSDMTLPLHSEGEWLGIVNATSNGTSQAAILALEFDTRHSFTEDGPDNHVGININSINSIQQVSLTNNRLNLSSGLDVKFHIQYINDTISVSGAMSGTSEESMETLLVTPPLNLSSFLQQEVYLGFSASTSNYTQRNCVRSWEFSGDDIRDDDKSLLWVYVAVPTVVVLIIIGGLVIFLLRRQKIRHMEWPEDAYPRIEDQIQYSSMAPKKFRLREITKATGGFSLQNKLGQGGFGTVYKGLLENKEVAVKRVSKNSRQGKKEFVAEVTTIGSLHHRNLVKLTGWCYENRELLLVYEFMPKGSLDKYLFGDKDSGNNYNLEGGYSITLNWETRLGVIHGVAQALDYLHDGCEKRVLHRDIKASNIMLDSDYNAKLGDFGLARTIQKRDETHHSTKGIAGTPGYMAPETFLIGRATVETDVYAFGVLVLEVVCGKRPGNVYARDDYKNSIVYWVWDLYGQGKVVGGVDARLKKEEIKEEEVECVLVLGLACCHPNPHKRPSMRTVLQVLNGEASPPQVPKERPAFMWPAMPPYFKDAEDSSLIQATLTPFTFTEIIGR
ncbi:probable L-type lectin-domain containing receptor kinase S.5 [Vigna unguiculata]|uniref:Protein kinase n=1 Tax=Vigna unguiculata TaxID=3917 RepID=A0A4D6MX12_VIGUN|nr:probable L-type lectin-domain containing receptor kinase S.5 [Vigna unguiculata]QCE05182.1 Protein kinase [Vigna unguiculata]